MRARDRMTGEVRWARIKSTAVRDPDGGVRLAINLIEDITELKRSEEAQRFLAEASRRLAGSLDYERTLAVGGRAGRPGDRRRLLARASPTATSSRRRTTLEVMRTGDARLEAHRMIVPMTAAGRVIGTITLSDRRARLRRRRTCWWRRTSGCAPARRSRTRGSTGRRREIARRCRRRCCRRTCRRSRARRWPPPITRRAQGLEVGGDFYDVFSTAEGQWYLVIGDVCGKGAEAAAVTALARYTLRTAAARRRSPAAILRWVGEAMLHQDAAGGRFCTIACAHVDLTRSPARVTVSCGGHPLPVAAPGGRARRAARRAGDAARARAGPGAAGAQHRPASRRRARALHRRADRGARAVRDVGRRGAAWPRCGPRR